MEYRLTEDWKDIKEIIILGFGKAAHDNIGFFKNFNIVYIVDSNKEKCNCEFKDILVKHVDDVKFDFSDYTDVYQI